MYILYPISCSTEFIQYLELVDAAVSGLSVVAYAVPDSLDLTSDVLQISSMYIRCTDVLYRLYSMYSIYIYCDLRGRIKGTAHTLNHLM